MRRPVPSIHEDATDLKQRWKAERQHSRRQRYHLLYLIASGQATTRIAAATHLGMDRTTIGQWLMTYERGGLTALMTISVPTGKAPALSSDQLAQLQAQLNDPAGVESYAAAQRWINTTFDLALTYNAVHKLIRYKLKAKLKVPRPQHPKKTLMP